MGLRVEVQGHASRYAVRRAIRATMAVLVVGYGGSASAGDKTLVVGAGDCKDSVLLGGVRDFQDLAHGLLKANLIEHEDALKTVRPQPTRSLDDLVRQVEVARSLLFNAQNEKAAEVARDALAELDRSSPTGEPWPTIVAALMLSAQISKNLDHSKEMNEAFRRILRMDPTYQGDPNVWPPSTLRAFEAVRKELQRSKKGVLRVSSLGGGDASVFVDGREVGKTPLKLELPQGTYRLSLVAHDTVSFPRVVKLGLGREESVQVDMGFEGSLSAQVPLCMSGEDSGALKFATALGASQVVVVRNGAQKGNPPYLTGVLYQTDRGERVRNAGIRPEHIRDLMMYLFTGEPDISKEPPPLAVPVAQPLAETGRVEARSLPWRPIEYTALGVGAATAIVGVVAFAATPRVQTDANGYVLAESVDKVRGAKVQQGVGVGLMVGGAAVAAAGAVAWLLGVGDTAKVRASVVPMAGGAAVVFGGELK